jgi:PilZ domain
MSMALASSAYRSVEPARIEQRVTERLPVVIRRATVRGHGRQPVDAELTDLSVYGCRLLVDARYRASDRLWLRFGNSAPVAAEAIWVKGDQLGCRFDKPLDRALFRNLTMAF